jgi:hypothetical protein
LIFTLLVTIIVEGVLILGYSNWQKKPTRPILYTSLVANLITQFLLWVVLNLFFHHYLISLFPAEFLIWIIESAMLYYVPANQLRLQEAIFLSLLLNLASFAIGWFLPV